MTPGSTGTPAAAIIALASIFEPMAAIASGDGPTNVEPGRRAVAGEPGVLREEPVAGVDGVGAGGAGGRDEQVAAQVGVGGGGAGQPDRLVGERDVRAASASASEKTATVAMPSSWAVRNTRAAISPRLATSSL